jgi:hypothetical protein
VRQFVDLGSGIPTVGRTDQIAIAADSRCRVAYVDTNLLAIAHAEVVLAENEQVAIARTDMRDVSGVFDHPDVRRLLDLTQPVALLMGAVVHFLSDDDKPVVMIDSYRAAVPSGSMLVLSHVTCDGVPPEVVEVAPMYRHAPEPMYDRTRQEIEALFDGWDLVAPGVAFTGAWRPAHPDEIPAEPNRCVFLAGAAVKP